MDIQKYLGEQRAALTSEFEALKQANEQARAQIASLEGSIKTRNEKMAQLQGAFAQLRHLEAGLTKTPEVVATDGPSLTAMRPRRRKEQAHG